MIHKNLQFQYKCDNDNIKSVKCIYNGTNTIGKLISEYDTPGNIFNFALNFSVC